MSTPLILRDFQITRDFRQIRWGATLWYNLLLSLLCIVALSSCTTMDANPTYNAPIKKGDSKQVVRNKMGRPNFRSVTDGRETWVYRGSNTTAMTLQTAGFAMIPVVGGPLALANAFSKPHEMSMVTITFNSSGRISKISRSFYEMNARL